MADITYIRMSEAFVYLAVVLDGFNRRVVGWAMADHLRAELALSALAMMISNGRLATIALVAVFCGLQVTRIHYEESLLSKSFPEWRAWAAGRPRLIPGVW